MKAGDAWRSARFPDGEISKALNVKIVVDQKTMESRSEYFHGGALLNVVPLNSKRAQQLAGYAAIQKDLKFVRKAISLSISMVKDAGDEDGTYVVRAEEDETADMLKALYVSFVVTYGKCFASAHRRRVKLDRKRILGENRKLMRVHDDVMHQRNEFIAHGGNTPLEQYQTVVLLHPDSSLKLEPSMATDMVHTNSWGVENLEKYLALTEFVREAVAAILEKKSEALYNAEVACIPLANWYKLT